MRSELIKLAKQVRLWAETKSERYDFPTDLSGMCCIVSRKLFRVLKANGLKPKIHLRQARWDSHAFVVCNGWIVDVTASQFGKIRVWVVRQEKYATGKWKTTEVFNSDRTFLRFMRKIHWSECQTTLRERLKTPKWERICVR
jgi:hypothetical protein